MASSAETRVGVEVEEVLKDKEVEELETNEKEGSQPGAETDGVDLGRREALKVIVAATFGAAAVVGSDAYKAIEELGRVAALLARLPEPPETPTPTLKPTNGPTPSSTSTPQRPTPTPLPTEASLGRVVLQVPLDAQDFSLSCEASAAAMAAAYFKPQPPEGFSNWEEYFVYIIPRDCNPHEGYRGKIDGYLSTKCEAPYGYGVYAEPIAAALQQAGILARVEYGVDYNAVAEEIKAGHPVIVWVSGKKDAIPQFEKDPESGKEYVLLLGEHAWTIVGVEGEGANRQFLVNDPWKGKQRWVKGFPRWDVFGGMRVVVVNAQSDYLIQTPV